MSKLKATKPKEFYDHVVEGKQINGMQEYSEFATLLHDVIQICNPKNILEIGFFEGGSSLNWLLHTTANVTSIDPVYNRSDLIHCQIHGTPYPDKSWTFKAVDHLKKSFPDRFTFINEDSRKVKDKIKDQKFDFIFIDGDHWEDCVRNDIQLVLDLEIDYMFLDDWGRDVEKVYQQEFSKSFLPLRFYDNHSPKQLLCKRINNKLGNLPIVFE